MKRIHTGGRPHNTLGSEDGRFVYLSPMGDPKREFIVDVEGGHEVVDHIDFGGSLRPAAISESRRLFFQLSTVFRDSRRRTSGHAARWRPWSTRASWAGFSCLSRGWGGSARRAFSAATDSFPHVDSVPLPAHGHWLTFTADGRYAFVALGEQGRVVMVEAQKRRVVWSLPAGRRPKRNLVVPALTAASTG